MPGLLKIGVTTTSPSERLPELQTTGVPTPFVLEASIRVVESDKAEKRIHAILSKWRHSSDREFFQLSVADALSACASNAKIFFADTSNQTGDAKPRTLTDEEEKVLLFVAHRTKTNRRPKRGQVQEELKLSEIKADYVLGSLLKRRFLREISEDREYSGGSEFGSYKVKVLKLESVGIQYLLDHRLLSQAEL